MRKSYRLLVNLHRALFIRLRWLLCGLALLLAVGQAQALPTSWSSVGNLSDFTEYVLYPSLAVSPSGVPHLAFIDGNNSNQVVVRQYSGGSWTSVGTGLPNNGTWTSLAFDSTGTAYVAFADNSSTFAYKLTVMKLVGSVWTLVGTQGFSTNSAAYITLAFDHADTPYVAFQDGAAAHLLTVVKYSAGSWADLGGATGFSAGAVYDSSLAFDSSNNPHVAYSDITSSGKPVVSKFSAGSWSILGGAPVSASAASYPALAIDATDHLYLAYSDGGQSNKLTVAVSTDAGVSWAAVGGFLGISSGAMQYTAIALDGAGNPYVAFQDSAISKLTVMKYELGWSIVGNAGFGSGAVTHVGIAFDPTDKRIPYAAAQDPGVVSNNLLLAFLPTAPSAPTGINAAGGDAQATITFTASALAGTSPITGYTVLSNPAGGVDQNAATTATSHTITGLTNGTSYTFTVTATNAAGDSVASSASAAVTPQAALALPGAPDNVVATVTALGAVTVTFTAPTTGGGSITGYTVFDGWGDSDVDAGTTALSHHFNGLVSDGSRSYSFYVVATNSSGPGSASVYSNVVVPAAPAAAPFLPILWNDLDVSSSYSSGDVITLTFSQPVNVANLTVAGMSVNNSHALGVPTLAAVAPSGGASSVFQLTVPASGWTAVAGDVLTIVANNVLNEAGIPATADVSFTLPAADNKAPTLSGVSVTPASTSASASVSSNEAATYFWFASPPLSIACDCSQPNATQIFNHTYNPNGSGAFSPVVFGSGTITAAMPATIAIGSLTASTSYTLWVVAMDAANNLSQPLSANFTTAAAPVVDTTPPPPPPVVVPPVVIPPLPTSVSITPVTDPSTIFTGTTGAIVDPTSGVVVLSSTSTTPVTLSNTAPDNVGIKPATNVPVTFTNSQGNSVTVTGLTGDTLLVTRKVGSTTLIEVASGTARIEPSSTTAIPLLSKTDNSTATLSPGPNAAATSVVVRRNDTGIAAFIETGSTVYKSVDSQGNSTPDATVYSGETANFSNQGNVDQVKLGSLDGDRNLPGDPIKNIPNVDPGLIVPQLGGNVARLGGESILDSLKNQIDAALGSPPGAEVSFDPASGVVVYKLNGVEARFIPLGNLLISLTGFADNGFVATNAGQTASGTFKLVDRGVQLTLASTLGYFTDFDAAVKASDPAGKVTLKASGALWIDLLGSQYITQPGYLAQNSGLTGQPNVYFGSDGQLAFRDSKGGVQVLYPTLADAATLQNILASLAPGASVKPQGDGTAAANVLGTDYTLLPQYQLVAVPGKYIMSTWWLDNGTLYYTMPKVGKAQGFTVK